MRITNITFYSVCIFLITCCDNKDTKIEYYDNNSIKSRSELVDGVKNGEERFYHSNGKILSIHNYKDGKATGVGSFYDNNGKLTKWFSYIDGIKDGPYEIYYRNGNIAESGNIRLNNRRGKIIQYYELDSGKIKNEIYSIDYKDMEIDYYVKRFDKSGNVISFEKPLEVILPNDTLFLNESVLVGFKTVNKVYDSAIVVIGDFDNPNYLYKKQDTVRFTSNECWINFVPSQLGIQFFRGQWILYKTEQDSDSTYQYTSFGLFEERLIVVNTPRYQAKL